MSATEPPERSPIVFIPGLAGSALEAKLDRTDAPAWWCTKKTNGYKRVWFSFSEASKPSCLLDELALFYDDSTGRYRNHDGVEIRAVDFGGLGGIDALHPGLPRLTPMFSKLTQAFKDQGYQERRHLFGAPYDFRLAPDGLEQDDDKLGEPYHFRLAPDGLEQEGYFDDLAQLIEGAVDSNGGRPATIVAHSLGCLVSLYFIARRSHQWLQKHVSGLVAISGPWGGAVSSLKGSISGDNFDAPVIPHNIFRPLQSSAPSGPWMFPAPEMWRDQVLVSSGSREYTGEDAMQLLQDLGLKQQAALYPKVHDLTYPLPKLDMRVHCLHGTGVDTAEHFTYDIPRFSDSAPPAPSHVRQGPGDGTVNLRSLEAGRRLGNRVSMRSFQGASHTGILQDQRLVDEVLQIAMGKSRAKTPGPNWGVWPEFLGAAISRGIGRLVS